MAEKNAVQKDWKKKNIEFRDVKELKEITGRYIGKRKLKEVTDEQTGEVRDLNVHLMEDLDSGAKFQFFEDGGVRNALEVADVKPGDELKLVHLGKIALKGKNAGKTCNQYDIFVR